MAKADAEAAPRTRLVLTALDLLRRSGLSGAGINQVVEASGAPKGSVYHYFPGGKEQLVVHALREGERAVGAGLAAIFGARGASGRKVRALFGKTAAALEANAFAKGCPVAAVTLDLDGEPGALREVCEEIFEGWVRVIADGLDGVARNERRAVAQLVLATLEGGLVLARARASKAPLLESGRALAGLLQARR